MFYLALSAAIVCAICSGVAAILQKVSASKEKEATSLDFGLLWQLMHNLPFVLSIVLDLMGGAAGLFSVRTLPLFLAQSVIAASVVVTALIDRFVLKHHMRKRTYAAVGLVLVGLVLLGAAAQSDTSTVLTSGARWVIVFGPLVLVVLALPLLPKRSRAAGIGISLISGLAFGGTAIAGRVVPIPDPLWHILYDPISLAVAAYALVAILLFTIALQRGSATATNAAMVSTETLLPALVGLLILNDHVRHGFLPVLIVGVVLTLAGVWAVLHTHKGAA